RSCVRPGLLPSCQTRLRTSRSGKFPATSWSDITTVDPILCSFIDRTASATLAETGTVTTVEDFWFRSWVTYVFMGCVFHANHINRSHNPLLTLLMAPPS